MDLGNNDEKLLFKFIPVNQNLIRILVTNKIWHSSFDRLNDPYEGKYRMSIEPPSNDVVHAFYRKNRAFFGLEEGEEINRVIEVVNDFSRLYFDVEKYVNVNYLRNRKVSCYSLTFEEILLWSHYADEHRGVCLVFKKNSLIKGIQKKQPYFNFSHRKVQYTEKSPIDVKFFNINNTDMQIQHLNDIIYKKLSCWSYEKEFRIVMQKTKEQNESGLSIEFLKESLCGIIFGQRCTFDDMILLHSILNQYKYVSPNFNWGYSMISPEKGKVILNQLIGNMGFDELLEEFNYRSKIL
jgi:hypothetical protein